MNKICFICDTPYQLFNALNLSCYIQKSRDVTIDLYVEPQFHDAKLILDQISKKKLFSTIKLYKCNSIINSSSIKSYFYKIVSILSPKFNLRKCLSGEKMQDLKYDEIYCSVCSYFALSLYRINNKSKLVFFDDGNGSYSDNIITKSFGNVTLYKFLGVDLESIKPTALFVNNVKMCKSTVTDNILPLPKITEEFLDYAKTVFSYSDVQSNAKVIWLTQPDEFGNSCIPYDNEVIKNLQHIKNNVMVRMHPRQKDTDKTRFSDFSIDNNKNLWELRISDPKIDDCILMGIFSSAQINPKLLFDHEPFIIFFYKCYHDLFNEQQYCSAEETVNTLKSNYKDPNKIKVIDHISELPETISEFLNYNGNESLYL